ncbi:protein ADM2 [Rhinatrema bivittatum]|uniref:protein ADM2 n=1 Tax=Rhinatrema bivittatum TaxID=194408 RepID=UPI001127C320|nr:protein ADM2 [Rhinatrema bivittatum]XP_029471507.1 protein ADM2 [Rhinatrema bivittatum]
MSALRIVTLGCISLLCLPRLPVSETLLLPSGQRDLALPGSREPTGNVTEDGHPQGRLLTQLLNHTWAATETRADKAAAPGPRPSRLLPNTWPHFREKRNAHHRPHMMRVACVLGTCQVQNLSHRLWQLVGQSGREDSSRISPHSPHSYG